jgi:hypothetical protein
LKTPDISSHLTTATSLSKQKPTPTGDQRTGLLGDLKLATGIINLGWQQAPPEQDPELDGAHATPEMAIAFDRPVINRAGSGWAKANCTKKVRSKEIQSSAENPQVPKSERRPTGDQSSILVRA